MVTPSPCEQIPKGLSTLYPPSTTMDQEAENQITGSELFDKGGRENESESTVACNMCRRRKLRCSKEMPTCQQCKRIGSDCEYKGAKGKPGLRAGAVENLHRRLTILEQAFDDRNLQGVDPAGETVPSQEISVSSKDMQQALTFFARELQKFTTQRGILSPSIGTSRGGQSTAAQGQGQGELGTIDQDDKHVTGESEPESNGEGSCHNTRERKRPRLQYLPCSNVISSGYNTDHCSHDTPDLPPPPVLQKLIMTYFSHIHPWIPMIHETRFHRRLLDPLERPQLLSILHAIILTASRYYLDQETASSLVDYDRVRNWILLTALGNLTIESLQALIIVAFNDIGNGEGDRTWSIISSLTRTAGYLQLTVERDKIERQTLLRPALAQSATRACSWVEAEERRRVFWTIFNLDRFCSVTMGWSISLTSDDVWRRLPCDVYLWNGPQAEDPDGEPIITPYLNVWDKAAGCIGNPINFLPHYSPPSTESYIPFQGEHGAFNAGTYPGSPRSVSLSTIGAFALSVEATESLSRVTTFFLQQAFNKWDPEEVWSWLTRFKELDLRLAHWKMLLPQKWRVDVTSQPAKMDPNLTLAHITHNTSIILLHQPIAFPPMDWSPLGTRLPSSASVDTCYTAAVEVASITRAFLKVSPPTLPLSNQFAFCVFIAARVLLFHWQYCAIAELPLEFRSLVDSLNIMAQRWLGVTIGPHSESSRSLAAKYAQKLQELHQCCTVNELFRINVTGYPKEIVHRTNAVKNELQTEAATSGADFAAVKNVNCHESVTGLKEPPPDYNNLYAAQSSVLGGIDGSELLPTVGHRGSDTVAGDLSHVGHIAFSRQSLELDPYIDLEREIFGLDYTGKGWD
ncbi:fungal-specific transcription factor domain-containing protein [Aspergillus heterothallicus]